MKWQRKWPSAFDPIKLCTGSGAELGLHSDSVQTICREFAARRSFLRRCPGWRSAKKSLGWVPFILRAVQVDGANVTYLKRRYQLWLSRDIGGEIKAGCFVQDARGRWYIALQCEVAADAPTGAGEIGIDLGLQALATCSDGRIVPALQHYRRYEAALAKARRANNTRRVRAIHAKVANARRHHLHEQSTRRRQCERDQADQDADGQIRARRRLVDVPQPAPLQGQQARCSVCGSRRAVDFPTVFRLRCSRRP